MINSKVTNIKNIRKKTIPYMLSWIIFYAWLVMFFTWWINNFKNNYIFNENRISIISCLLLLIIPIISYLTTPDKFKKYFKVGGIGSLVIILSYYIFNIIQTTSIIKNIIYILPLFMGLTYAGLLQSYIYIMNNTEKFFTIIFGNFLLMILSILNYYNIININNNYIYFIIMLISSLLFMIKFNTKDYKKEEEKYSINTPKTSKILYISLLINCIFLVFCRGVGRAFVLLANDMYTFNLEIYYYLGGLVGCIILIILYKNFEKCNILTWNIVFGSFIFAAILYMYPAAEFIKNMYAFILGIGILMGICSMYYTLGVISKKYWDFSYTRYNILIIDILGCGLGTFLGNYIYSSGSDTFNMIILTISVIMMIILLIISPILLITFFKDKWDEDSTKAIIDNYNIRKFSKYNFTSKEMEVCNYMLQSLTVRQIAANMNISENTVKFHKKQIFKKLNINSKEEFNNILNNG